VRREELVSLVDLFGIATGAAGRAQKREGTDVLGILAGVSQPRQQLFGYYGPPGTPRFKIMVRSGDWKYIYLANGGREQLFHLREDPGESRNLVGVSGDLARSLRSQATSACDRPGLRAALDSGGLRGFPFAARPRQRIYQFDRSRGVRGFPTNPEDILSNWRWQDP
jgi:choline-sulfatase